MEPAMHRVASICLCLALFTAAPAAATGEIALPLSAAAVPVAGELRTAWQWPDDGGRLVPEALDVHPSGSVWGLEARRHRLFRCGLEGEALTFAAGGEGAAELGFATRVFARSGLKIFTLDPWNQALTRYDLTGVREGGIDLAARLAAAGELLREASDFCLRRSGELFVLDRESARVFAFDAAGRFDRVLGELGAAAPRDPIAIEIDGHGRLYLLEAEPPALLVLDLDAERFRQRPLAMPAPRAPLSLAVDPWGNAFIGDAAAGRVWVAPHTGAPGWWLQAPEGRLAPDDLAADGARLLVADRDARKVWVFALTYERREPADGGPSGPR
jgi:hypothetical protein